MGKSRFVVCMALAMLAGCASENGDERWNTLMEAADEEAAGDNSDMHQRFRSVPGSPA